MSLFSKLFGGNKPNAGGGAGRAKEFINTLTTDLDLSPDQVSKLEGSLRNFFVQKKELKKQGRGKEDKRELKQDFKQDILAVLNLEQQQKFMANISTYKDLIKN